MHTSKLFNNVLKLKLTITNIDHKQRKSLSLNRILGIFSHNVSTREDQGRNVLSGHGELDDNSISPLHGHNYVAIGYYDIIY